MLMILHIIFYISNNVTAKAVFWKEKVVKSRESLKMLFKFKTGQSLSLSSQDIWSFPSSLMNFNTKS